MATVLATIIDVIREIRPSDTGLISAHTAFRELADWDPSDLVAIAVETECRFGLHFELGDINRLVTVGDLVRLVTAKQAPLAA